MNTSSRRGRVGAVAVAVGLGAAILAAGPAVARADVDSPGVSGNPPNDSAAEGASSTPRGPRRTPEAAGSGAGSAPRRFAADDHAVVMPADRRALRAAAARQAFAAATNRASTSKVAAAQASLGQAVPAELSPVEVAPDSATNPAAPMPGSSVTDGLEAGFVSLNPLSSILSVPTLSTVRSPVAASATAGTRFSPRVALGIMFTGVVNLSLALRREFSIGTINLGPPSPTLVLNGYDVVPSSTETVTSFYGRWTYLPGGPGMVQGQQQFDVVDPVTGEKVGSFDALVSRGYAFNYTALLVTANDGGNVGIGAGQVPPVGSVIADCTAGNIGWRYSAMPSASGDVVSFKIVTPFGSIRLPIGVDGAEGLADHTVDNRPVGLGNGYTIAPSDPTGETFTGTSGILPFFSAVQGYQKFSVYDSDGNPVGSFDGVFTTTEDIADHYTQAILVTANEGTNVGTGAGQVPPVGSVYNVIYAGDDDHYITYSSLPSPSGDVITVIKVTNGKVSNISTWPLTLLNASAPPLVPALSMPKGNSFVPVSALLPMGVNGLPPREVQVQGYQQFDVYDAEGNRIGAVNADVTTQWDLFGIYSESLLITNVIEGTAGTGAGQVAPVGSVYEFVYFGSNRLGTAYSALPSEPCAEITFRFLTPFGSFPLRKKYNATGGLADVSYFDPFVTR